MEIGKTPIRRLRLAAVALLVAVCASLSPVARGETSSATKPSPTRVARSTGGDIPDTATYLRYKGRSYSIEYVEGWVQVRLSGDGVRMRDIDSFEQVTFQSQPRHSLTSFVQGPGLTQTKYEYQRVVKTSVGTVRLHAGSAVRLIFHARSAPDPVTGKQVTLVIDRYYVSGRTHLAVITLATPVGVDNVDAFRRIAQSFGWTKR